MGNEMKKYILFFMAVCIVIIFGCEGMKVKNNILQDNIFISSAFPKIKIRLNQDFKYIGKVEKKKYEKDLAWAHYEIGFCLLLGRKYDEAKVYFQKVINEYSQLAPITLSTQRLEEIQKIRSNKRRRQKKK